MLNKKNILGVGVTNAKKEEILEYILKNCKNPNKKWYIVTPNPEILVKSFYNSEYKNILNSANLALADGIGVIWAGKFLGKPLKERFTGVDLIESTCKRINDLPITVGFFGGQDNVAEKASERLQKEYPKLKISFVGQSDKELLSKNHNFEKPIDILFVALGFPKQEMWIYKNLERAGANVAIGVGGAFDFLSGRVLRAPKILQNLGLEWMFRLFRQPWRIKRQIALFKFVVLVLKEKFS